MPRDPERSARPRNRGAPRRLQWEKYLDLTSSSGVDAFAIGPTHIAVRFKSGEAYLYDHARPGKEHVDEMKKCAREGKGLSTYISQHVQDAYAENLN